MKRYDLVDGDDPVIGPDEDGFFVLYDDHIEKVKRQDTEIAALKEELRKLEEYKNKNYDPTESIRLNGEIMRLKEQVSELKELAKIDHQREEELEGLVNKLESENKRLRSLIINHSQNCRGWFGEDKDWENEIAREEKEAKDETLV